MLCLGGCLIMLLVHFDKGMYCIVLPVFAASLLITQDMVDPKIKAQQMATYKIMMLERLIVSR